MNLVPATINTCPGAVIASAGTSLSCTFVVQSFDGAVDAAKLNFTLYRQNRTELAAWTKIYVFKSLPSVLNYKDRFGAAVRAVSSVSESGVSGVPFTVNLVALVDASSGSYDLTPSGCEDKYTITGCFEASIGSFNCTVDRIGADFSDCMVQFTPKRWDVPGTASLLRILPNPPNITAVSPVLLFSDNEPYLLFNISGLNFWSSAANWNEPPVVTLRVNSRDYPCAMVGYTAVDIQCRVAINQSDAMGADVQTIVSRYDVRGTRTATQAFWRASLKANLEASLDLSGTGGASLPVFGTSLCVPTAANFLLRFGTHPNPITQFNNGECDTVGQTLSWGVVSSNATVIDLTLNSFQRPTSINCIVEASIACGDSSVNFVPVASFRRYPFTFMPLGTLVSLPEQATVSDPIIYLQVIDAALWSGVLTLGTGAGVSCSLSVVPNAADRVQYVTCSMAGTLPAAETYSATGTPIYVQVSSVPTIKTAWGIVVLSPGLGAGPALVAFDVFNDDSPTIFTFPVYNLPSDTATALDASYFTLSFSNGGDSSISCSKTNITLYSPQFNLTASAQPGNYTLTIPLPAIPSWDRCFMSVHIFVFDGGVNSFVDKVTRLYARPVVTSDDVGLETTDSGSGVDLKLAFSGVFLNPVVAATAPTVSLTSNCTLSLSTLSALTITATPNATWAVTATVSGIVNQQQLRSGAVSIDGCLINVAFVRYTGVSSRFKVSVGRVALAPGNPAVVNNPRIYTNIMSSINVTGEYLTTYNSGDSQLIISPRDGCNMRNDSIAVQRASNGQGKWIALYINLKQPLGQISPCTADLYYSKVRIGPETCSSPRLLLFNYSSASPFGLAL